jgi:hypothetical protein
MKQRTLILSVLNPKDATRQVNALVGNHIATDSYGYNYTPRMGDSEIVQRIVAFQYIASSGYDEPEVIVVVETLAQ